MISRTTAFSSRNSIFILPRLSILIQKIYLDCWRQLPNGKKVWQNLWHIPRYVVIIIHNWIFYNIFLGLKRLRLSGGIAYQDAKDWCNTKAFHNLNGRQQPIVTFTNLQELTLKFVRMRHIKATTEFIFKMSQNISRLEWWPPVDNFHSTCSKGR